MRHPSSLGTLDLEIDMRPVLPAERATQVVGMFGALERGEGFVFLDDQPPTPVLSALQERFDGEFDWRPLDQQPSFYRVALARRGARLSPLRRVLDFMSTEHRFMEQMLHRIRDEAGRGEWEAVAEHSGFLESTMRRHIRMEEEVLFPEILSRRTDAGCAQDLDEIEEDHRRLLGLLARLRGHVAEAEVSWRPSTTKQGEVVRLAAAMLRAFFTHEHKEERLLYGAADLALDRRETEALVRRCQSI